MRVAMVSEHASPLAGLGTPDAGGQNVHVAALATAVAALGHEVTVYTRRDDPHIPERVPFAPGVTVAHVPAGPPEPIPKDDIVGYVPDFARWLREQWTFDRPDVAHSHFWMSGLATLDAARRLGVPVAHTFHALGTVKRRHQGVEDTSPATRIPAERTIGRTADVIVSTCPDEVEELVRMGVPRHQARVVPCGVDLDLFRPDASGAPERPRLLSIGRLVPRKGVQTVVQALPCLPEVELVVGGGLPIGDLDRDEEVNRLRAEADRLGVSGQVRFVGQVARQDVPGLMRSATAVVCVPWYEPFGMVVLEAMACGVPVIASSVGGQQDTVVHEETGLLVPAHSPREVVRATRRLLADPAARAAYGTAGARRASIRYSWDRVAAETVSAYGQAMLHLRRTAAS